MLDLRKRELAGRAPEAWALVPALPQGFQEKDLGSDPFPAHSFSSSEQQRAACSTGPAAALPPGLQEERRADIF